ncbi:unnamed protein product [Symbiodinium microadriaticum]|nr:unnamed protein product [Symbiodinium microadriaticum]
MWSGLFRSHLSQPTLCRRAWAHHLRRSWHSLAASSVQAAIALPGDALEILQEKNSTLRAMLQTLQWPRLLRFHGYGETHELPLRSDKCKPPGALPAADERVLQYLAGFFDGDGCVFGGGIHVVQCFDRAEVLMLFRTAFGGSITKNRDGKGLNRPILQWRVFGQAARQAASLLAPRSITKHRQLLLLAGLPPQASSRSRQECTSELSFLKRFDSAVSRECSVEYFTGLFDADGHIALAGNAALRVEVSQKFGTVLRCLQHMLAHDLGIQASLYHLESKSTLRIRGTSACKAVLREMLGSGMLAKARQAELAVNVTLQNAVEVGKEMTNCVGNQTCGKRQDHAGRVRALKIARMQAKARAGIGDSSQLQELHRLRCEHTLLNAQHANRELREYIHMIQSLCGECWDVA